MDGYNVELLGSACRFARSNRQLPDPDPKKTMRIIGAIVSLLGAHLKNWLLKCHAEKQWKTYFLTTSSPASLGKFAAWEVAAAGGECFGFDGVFHPDYRNCQYEVMKLLHVLKQKFDTAVPDFNKCVIIIEHPHKTKYIRFFFKKHVFSSKNKIGLLTYLLFLGSLKILVDY